MTKLKAASKEICLSRVSEASEGMAALLRNLASDSKDKDEVEELVGMAAMLDSIKECTLARVSKH